MYIFDGVSAADSQEVQLKAEVDQLKAHHIQPTIAAILFTEDEGSALYTRVKGEAAERVGMRYQVHPFSILEPVHNVIQRIQRLNQDPEVHGIIIQKPRKSVWSPRETHSTTDEKKADFTAWWQQLVQHVEITKDVDGLHPRTLAAVKDGTWREKGYVLPATCAAVLQILSVAAHQLEWPVGRPPGRTLILGISDLLGRPLAYELENRGWDVALLSRVEIQHRLESAIGLKDAACVVSATGKARLVRGEHISPGVTLIDVGEPHPDIDRASVEQAGAAFLTPVPRGVGPLTVLSLLKNGITLANTMLY